MTTVAIARQERYDHIQVKEKLQSMLEDLGILRKIRGSSVLIKPNCTGIFSPEEGRTTHPMILEMLVEILQQVKAKVRVGESSSVGVDTWAAYEQTGIKRVAEKLGVPLIDFRKSSYAELKIDGGLVLKKTYAPKEILEADHIISLAKMKTNYVSHVSCSMKNMKGILPDREKKKFHKIGISKAIADLNGCFSNVIGIVEGILACELDEPIKGNVLIASNDVVACDSVCARIMGLQPYQVEHVKLAEEKKVGIADLEKTKIIGEDISTITTNFRSEPPGFKHLEEKYGVKIINGNPCSACIGGLYLGLKKAKMTRPELLEGNLRIALGSSPEEDNSPDLIRYGLCSHPNHQNNNHLYVAGCVPTSSDLIKVLERYQQT